MSLGSADPCDSTRLTYARLELAAATRRALYAHAAAQWGARAIVAFEKYKESKNQIWLLDATLYEHEALCHAAAGDSFAVVQTAIAVAKRAAFSDPTPNRKEIP